MLVDYEVEAVIYPVRQQYLLSLLGSSSQLIVYFQNLALLLLCPIRLRACQQVFWLHGR